MDGVQDAVCRARPFCKRIAPGGMRESAQRSRAAVPEEWHSFQSRYIGRAQGRLGELAAQFTARGAVHPMQAMLNFSTAIVTARLARAILASGLDPCSMFQRGVALLHSFWWQKGRQTFPDVLDHDPSCAIATGAQRA